MNELLIEPAAQTLVVALRSTFGGNATIKRRGAGPEVDIIPDAEMSRNIRRQSVSFFKSPSQIGFSIWPIVRPYVIAGGFALGVLLLLGFIAIVSRRAKD